MGIYLGNTEIDFKMGTTASQLEDYYKKNETSSSTELEVAFSNVSVDLTDYYKKNETSSSTELEVAFSNVGGKTAIRRWTTNYTITTSNSFQMIDTGINTRIYINDDENYVLAQNISPGQSLSNIATKVTFYSECQLSNPIRYHYDGEAAESHIVYVDHGETVVIVLENNMIIDKIGKSA